MMDKHKLPNTQLAKMGYEKKEKGAYGAIYGKLLNTNVTVSYTHLTLPTN